LVKYLATFYGKHSILIGVPNQESLLKESVTARQTLLTPIIHPNKNLITIESDFYELPISSGSVDLVILPHSLEYTENPRQLLSESTRIIKPEGHLIILGFNPFSFYGIKKMLHIDKVTPWNNTFIRLNKIKKWLSLVDFELVKQDFVLYGLPKDYPHFKFWNWIAHIFLRPFGGVYILIAKAKVIPMTPIRLRWKQTFSHLQVPLTKPSLRKF